MTPYQETFSKISDMNPLHLETLAYSCVRTLNGQSREFFEEIAAYAKSIGPARLQRIHEMETVS